jgi:hypothetical protein
MTQAEAIERLEREWDQPAGFFARLRMGDFDVQQAQAVAAVISSLELEEETLLSKRLVSLLWYLPLFGQWQTERVAECGGNLQQYRSFVTKVTNILEQKLGVP